MTTTVNNVNAPNWSTPSNNSLAQTGLNYASACTVGSLEGADKFAKLGKACIGLIQQIGEEISVEVPKALSEICGMFQAVNAINVLFQPIIRLREAVNGDWHEKNGERGFNWWSKFTLTAGQTIEFYLLLVSTSVISSIKHPVFQNTAEKLQNVPYLGRVFNFVFDNVGLEIVKNGLILASASYGLKKVWAAMPGLTEKARKAEASLEKYKGIKALDDDQTNRSLKKQVLANAILKKMQKQSAEYFQTDGLGYKEPTTAGQKISDALLQNGAQFIDNQIDRLQKKTFAAKEELAKAQRASTNEWGKITVVGIATVGMLGGFFVSKAFKGAFFAVQIFTGINAVQRIARDSEWGARKAAGTADLKRTWKDCLPPATISADQRDQVFW